ncbi:hypothetical protein D3C72_1965470 [compost metagenome]
MAHQHEIAARKLPGLLNGVDVRRTLHHANQTVFLTTRVRTDIAHILLGEGTAVRTVTDFRHGAGECLRQAHPAAAVAL